MTIHPSPRPCLRSRARLPCKCTCVWSSEHNWIPRKFTFHSFPPSMSPLHHLPCRRLQSTRHLSPLSSITRPPPHTVWPPWHTTQLLPQWLTTPPTFPQCTTPPTVSPTTVLPTTSPLSSTMLLPSTTLWLTQSSTPLQFMQSLTQLLTTLLRHHTMMHTSPPSAPLTTPRPGVSRIPSTPPTRSSMPFSTTTRACRQSTRMCWPTLRTAWTG